MFNSLQLAPTRCVYITLCYIPSTAQALSAKPPSAPIGGGNIEMEQPSDYLTPIGGGNIVMGKNASYGHVIMTGQHVLPLDDSENMYDKIDNI